MAGYSGTPLPRKLGIKPGARVVLRSAPAEFATTLGELPEGVIVSELSDVAADVILWFVTERAALAGGFERVATRLDPAGGLWICWPKKSSSVPSDLTENVIRDLGLPTGLVDNKVCAIDDVWSGLRFVVRIKDRPNSARPARTAV